MDRQQSNSQTGRSFSERARSLSRYLCVVAAITPVLAALGWIFDIDLLKRIHPVLPAMQPNAVFGLFLCILAILLTGRHRGSGKSSAALTLAVVVLLLGLLTLGEYVLAKDFGIDRAFVPERTELPYPGRPSPQTAASLALLGAALILYNLRSLPISAGQVLADLPRGAR